MSDILASVSVILGAEISGFKAAMADARKELRGLVQFSEGLKDIGTSLTTYVSAPLALLAGAAVAASGKIESLSKGLQAITLQELGKQGVTGLDALQQAAQLTTERMAELRQIAKTPGLGFEGAVQGDVRLRAVGISAEQSAKSIKAFANAVATTGGGKNEFDRVTVQLAQLSAKGKVLAQDLRPIIEAAPAVSGALQRLYGTVDSETISASLQKQGQSSSDFVATLTDELAKLPQVQGGLKNAFENLADTGTLALAKFGDGISKALNLPGLLQSVSDSLSQLSDYFSNLSPGVQKAVVIFGGLVAATGPLLVAVGTLGAALPAITAGFATLGVTSLAALGPILPVAAAVAAAAYLIYENWDSITAYFSPSGEGGRLFSDLADSVKLSVASISQAFSQLKGLGDNSLGGLITATGIFKSLFQDLAIGVRSFSDTFGGIIGAAAALLRGDFSQAAGEAQRALGGLIDPLAGIFGFTKNTQQVGGLKELFAELSSGADAAKESIEGLAGGNIAGLTTQLGLLEALKQKLQEVTAQREKETSPAAVSADNAQIKSLQAQINALEGVDKSGKKATDAITKLRTELAALSALDDVLAVPAGGFDNVNRRVTALNSGLKTLLEAGIKPTSAAFKAFAAESLTLQQGLDKVLASTNLAFKPIDLKLKVTVGDFNPDQVGKFSQELLDHPVLVPFKLQPLKTDFSSDILNQNIALDKAFAANAASATVFGDRLEHMQANANATRDALQSLLSAGLSPTNTAIQQLSATYRQQTTDAENYRLKTEALKDGLAAFGTSVGTAIGAAIFAGAGVASVFKTIAASIIDALADYAEKKGKLLIALGIGDIAFGNVGQGALELAGGVGLLAAAGVARAGASALASTAPSSSSSSPTTTNYGQNSGTQTIKVVAEFSIRGKDLVAVGREMDYRSELTD